MNRFKTLFLILSIGLGLILSSASAQDGKNMAKKPASRPTRTVTRRAPAPPRVKRPPTIKAPKTVRTVRPRAVPSRPRSPVPAKTAPPKRTAQAQVPRRSSSPQRRNVSSRAKVRQTVPAPLPRTRPRFHYEPPTPKTPKKRNLKKSPLPPPGTGSTPSLSFSVRKSPFGPASPQKKGNGNGGNGGNGNGNGNGGNGGNGNGGHDRIIYCCCCGLPWWDCAWCRFWTPMWWFYSGYDYFSWNHYWLSDWNARFIAFHEECDLDDLSPSIYTPPALIIDPNSEAIALLDKGAALFREGRYQEAMEVFLKARLADLDLAVPRFAYAHSLFALGFYGLAAREIRGGMELMPEWVDMGGDLKLMYGDEKDFEEQLEALISYLKVLRDDEDALLVLGYVSYFSGDLYKAEKAFTKLAENSSAETAEVAGTFISAIDTIKERLAAEGKDSSIIPDDGVTIDDLLEE